MLTEYNSYAMDNKTHMDGRHKEESCSGCVGVALDTKAKCRHLKN